MHRLVDANLNRLGEGLRVLEDIARFLLEDGGLTQELKHLRHHLTAVPDSLQRELLSARQADRDVGASIPTPTEEQRADVAAIVRANARRAQEALRVLEEWGKLSPESLEVSEVKRARFELYSLEQRLLTQLWRRERREKVSGLYVIVDPQLTCGRNEAEVTGAALRGGARIIQLRDKQRSKGEGLPVARELKELCAEAGALFIINDHPDLALACGADGVHLGQKDLPLAVARRILPLDRLIGVSAATPEEAAQAQKDGADYVAVGSIYPTSSKVDTRSAGLDTLFRVRPTVSVPLVAIGGINEENVGEVVAAGANAVAVISAVAGAEDVEAAARRMVAKIEGRA